MAADRADSIPRDLYHATKACRRSLEECQSITPLMEGGWAENRLGDFKLWAAGVGASARTRASLDWRLHFQPQTRIVIAGLLVTLRQFIEQCKDLGLRSERGELVVDLNGEEVASSWSNQDRRLPSETATAWFDALDGESTDEESSVSEYDEETNNNVSSLLGKAMKSTEEILDELIWLGHRIRKAGTTSRLQRADNSFNQSSYEDLQRYLSLVLLVVSGNQQSQACLDVHMRNLDVNTSYTQLSSEQKHLVIANLRRRHRFVYAELHQKKLEEALDIGIAQETEWAAGHGRSQAAVGQNQNHPSAREEKPAVIKSTGRSHKAAATAASVIEGDTLATAPTPSQAASQASVTTAKLSYPLPPPVPVDARGFKCPCCCQTLPKMFTEMSRWRKHISEDLCPYTCPFSDCAEGSMLYPTRQGWKSHINDKHGGTQYWECLSCVGTEISGAFPSAEDLAVHIRTHHPKTITQEQIPALQELGCRIAPPLIPSCPLGCPFRTEWRLLDAGSRLEHIGDCIHDFSLRALPWAELDGNVESARHPELDQSVFKWLNSMDGPVADEGHGLRFIHVETNPPLLACPFVRSEYFAEESDDSCRVEKGPPSTIDTDELCQPQSPGDGEPLDGKTDTRTVPTGGSQPSENSFSYPIASPGQDQIEDDNPDVFSPPIPNYLSGFDNIADGITFAPLGVKDGSTTSEFHPASRRPQAGRKSRRGASSLSRQLHCGTCAEPFRTNSDLQEHVARIHSRPFICVFAFAGCTITLNSKNEWKRHVISQHVILNYWICTDPICFQANPESGGAIFSRKDLYTQHVRRMHTPDEYAHNRSLEWAAVLRQMQENAERRCAMPQYMRCPAEGCTSEFSGPNAWDDRMEHVARHLDNPGEPRVIFGGDHDETLTEWASSPAVNIVRQVGADEWKLVVPLRTTARELVARRKAVADTTEERASSNTQRE